ncbi:MAG: ABC transporter ATP-binding protein [Clostridiaceae bacterium]|nr:ABC transporter ATP-binding protein [Clostridiaceae bacterium]
MTKPSHNIFQVDYVEVCDLSWQPPTAPQLLLNHIDCRLEKGRFYGIIGPNGSGKTSLIRHLLALKSVQSGSIKIQGVPIESFSKKQLARHFAYVAQKIPANYAFTVFETVAMGLYARSRFFEAPSLQMLEQVHEAMIATETYRYKDLPFSVLSGGEAQRVLLARAIAQSAEWLFLDEPVSNLDVSHQVDMMEKLSSLCRNNGKTIVCVLHDINLAARYCDSILMMKEGRLRYCGSSNELLNPEQLRDIFDISFSQLTHPRTSDVIFVPDYNLSTENQKNQDVLSIEKDVTDCDTIQI